MKLALDRFMSYEKLDLTLPKRGLVLVTGPNGAGKSSLVEAVSYACFGKTLRGTDPLATDEGIARLERGDFHAIRARGYLDWGEGQDGYRMGDTVTKAQEALERVVGTWDSWRRTRVFSSADASLFSQSTDGERKRLLESVLGLERFDDALSACRSSLKSAEARLTQVTTEQDILIRRTESASRRLEDAERQLRSLPAEVDEGEILKQVAILESAVRSARKDVASFREARDSRGREVGRLDALRSAAQARLERLQRGECPECGQTIKPEALRLASEVLAGAEAVAAAAREEADRLAGLDAEVAEELEALRRKLSSYEGKLREARAVRPAREAAQRVKAENEEDLRLGEKEAKRLDADLLDARRAVDTRVAVEEVLGLRGVRAHVLGKALSGVEAVANRWLSRLGVPMRVSLKSHTEKKSGGVTDAISLEVGVDPSVADAHARLGGVTAKHGYRAASSGQRRRVDIALLLALAEVSSAARGGGPLDDILFLDEVFDAVDAEGQPAVARCLGELAAEKLVVVITHSEALRAVLEPTLSLRVEDGLVTVLP